MGMSGHRGRYFAAWITSAPRAGSDCERARTAGSHGSGQRAGVSQSGTGGLERRPRSATGVNSTGKAVQNAYVESFNGRLRDECLNANWFTSLSDARRKIEAWRQDYNQQRPHSSLDYVPPAEFARTRVVQAVLTRLHPFCVRLPMTDLSLI